MSKPIVREGNKKCKEPVHWIQLPRTRGTECQCKRMEVREMQLHLATSQISFKIRDHKETR